MSNDLSDGNDNGTVIGTDGDDALYGGISNGNANGGAVIDDTIDGGQGRDTIFGGDGDDLIFGGDAGDLTGGESKVVEQFTFDTNNADPVVDGGGAGSVGDSILYNNIATAEDGTPISVRITVVEQSDPNLMVTLGFNPNYPVLLNRNNNNAMMGETVKFRVDFLDAAGDPVTINSTFTFRDIDNAGGNGQETIAINKEDISNYAVSSDPPSDMTVTEIGPDILIGSNAAGNPSHENLWAEVAFESQSSLEFTISSRATGAGYGFDTATFTNPPIITEVDASGDDTLYGGTGNDSVLGGGGDDTLFGDEGDDNLFGGKGDDTLFGGDGDDTIAGGEGADTINGGAGLDVVDYSTSDSGVSVNLQTGAVSGGDAQGDVLSGVDGIVGSAHDDTLTGFDGQSTGPDGFTNIFYGGAGDDVMDGRDGDDTLFGGEGADSILGGGGADSIDGGAGNDEIDAGSGDDSVMGGAGADSIVGGAGDDSIDGGADGDDIDADAGNDSVMGGAGEDSIATGDGNDSIDGGADDDRIEAGAGADTLAGGAGSDRLYGGDGDDTLSGGDGSDRLYGGDGDDTFTGGAGVDRAYGGDGDDTMVLDANADGDTFFGGNGQDALDAVDSAQGVTLTYTDTTDGSISAGGNTTHFRDVEEVSLTDHADTVDASGSSSGVSVSAGAGNDIITGSDGADTIDGGTGNDTIDAGTGDNVLTGGDGVDTFVIRSADFSDVATDEELRNTLLDLNLTGMESWQGSKGHVAREQPTNEGDPADIDVKDIGKVVEKSLKGIIGKKAADDAEKLVEEAVEQFLDQNAGAPITIRDISDLAYETLLPDFKFIKAGIAGIAVYKEVKVQLGVTDEPVEENTLGDTITERASDIEITDFDVGTDQLDLSNLTYLGGSGLSTNDVRITDTAGDGNGDAVLTLPDGSKITLVGVSVYDLDPETLEGMGFTASDDASGFQNEFLTDAGKIGGGGGDDALTGSAGDEVMRGGDGADTMVTGGGRDTVDGGSDADRIVLTDDFDGTVVRGGETGDDNDTIDFSDASNGVTIIASNDEDGTFSNAAGDSGSFEGIENLGGSAGGDSIVAGDGDSSVDGGEGDDAIDSGAGNDRVQAGSGRDTVSGGAGDDQLSGDDGDDDLWGGDGSDTIDGGSGNDTVAGGAGNDTVSGGDGDDIFALSKSGGDDSISDFAVGNDQLETSDLEDSDSGVVTAEEVVVTGGGGSPQILTFPGGETVAVPDGSVDTSTPQAQFASLVMMGVPPCFAPGTRIETPDGAVAVENLKVGDLVLTVDHGPQPVRWIGRRRQTFAGSDDRHKPVQIKAGRLGDGLPERDLVVSPQHRMLMAGPEVEALFSVAEVLALAKGLTDLPGVRRMRGKQSVDYFALLFDSHQVIFAEGAPTESFRPGPVALASMAPEVLAEIEAIYPGVTADPEGSLGPPARRLLTRRETRTLVAEMTSPQAADRPDAGDFHMWDADLEDERAETEEAMLFRPSGTMH